MWIGDHLMSVVDVKQAPARTLERAGAEARARKKETVWQQIWRDRLMLLFVLPGVLYFILFRYLPLLGNIIAFEDYLPFRIHRQPVRRVCELPVDVLRWGLLAGDRQHDH